MYIKNYDLDVKVNTTPHKSPKKDNGLKNYGISCGFY